MPPGDLKEQDQRPLRTGKTREWSNLFDGQSLHNLPEDLHPVLPNQRLYLTLNQPLHSLPIQGIVQCDYATVHHVGVPTKEIA